MIQESDLTPEQAGLIKRNAELTHKIQQKAGVKVIDEKTFVENITKGYLKTSSLEDLDKLPARISFQERVLANESRTKQFSK